MADKLTFNSLKASDAWRDMVKERDYDSASSILDGIERRIQSDLLDGVQNGTIPMDQMKARGAAVRQRKRELMNEVYGNKVFDTSINAAYKDLLDPSGEKSSTAAFEAFIENEILPNELEDLQKGFAAFNSAKDAVDIGDVEDYASHDLGLHDKYEGSIVRAANLYDKMNGGTGTFESLDQVYRANTSGDFDMKGMDAMYENARKRVSSRVAKNILDPQHDTRDFGPRDDGGQIFVKDGVAFYDTPANDADTLKAFIDPKNYVGNIRNSNVSVGEAFRGALYHDVNAMAKLNGVLDNAIKGGRGVTGFGSNEAVDFIKERRAEYINEHGYAPNEFEEAKFAIDYIDSVSDGGIGQYLEYNVGQNFFSRLATGYESALSLLGSRENDSLRTDFWQTFMGIERGKDFSRFLSGAAERTKETREAQKNIYQSADKHNFIDDAIGLSGDLSHTLITMTGTGGAATVAGAGPNLTKAATVASAMFSEGTSTYVDSRDQLFRQLLNKGMEEGEAWDNAAQAAVMPTAGAVIVTGALGGFGTSGAVTDTLTGNAVRKATIGDIIKAAGSNRAFKKNIMDLAGDENFMKQLSSSVQRQLNNGNLTMRRMLGERGKRLAADFSEEAIEEGLVGAFTEIGNALGRSDNGLDPNLNFMDFVESVSYQAAVGGVFGSVANPAVGRLGDKQFKWLKTSDVTKQREKLMEDAQLQTLIYKNEKARFNGEESIDEQLEDVAVDLEQANAPKTAEVIRKKANNDTSTEIDPLETLTEEESKDFFGEEEGSETGIPSDDSNAATEKDTVRDATHPVYGEGNWAESELGGKIEYKKVGKVGDSDVSQAYYNGKPTDQFFKTKDGKATEVTEPIDSELVKPAEYTAETAQSVKSKGNKKGTSARVDEGQHFMGKIINTQDRTTLIKSTNNRALPLMSSIGNLSKRMLPNPITGSINIRDTKGPILSKDTAQKYIDAMRGKVESETVLTPKESAILNRALDRIEQRVHHLYDEGGAKLVMPDKVDVLKDQMESFGLGVQSEVSVNADVPNRPVAKKAYKMKTKQFSKKDVKTPEVKTPKKESVKAAQETGTIASKEGGTITLKEDSNIVFESPTSASPSQVELNNVKSAGYDPDFVNSHVLVPHGAGFVSIEDRGSDIPASFNQFEVGDLLNDNEIVVDVIPLPQVVDSRPDGTTLGTYSPVQVITIPVENDTKTDGYAIAQGFLKDKFSTRGNLEQDTAQLLYNGTSDDAVAFAQSYVNTVAPHLNIRVEKGPKLGFRMDGDQSIIEISSSAINRFARGYDNADALIAHISKAMDEEVVHVATMRSFIASEGGVEAAFQKLEDVGRGLWEKNLDQSVPYAFQDDSKTPEGYVRNAMEFLNIQVQRVRTGRSTADIAVNKQEGNWKGILKSYIQKARDAFKAFNQLFQNPEYADYIKNINNYLERGENMPTIADRVQKETEDSQKAAAEARERARQADLAQQARDMERAINNQTVVKDAILDNILLDNLNISDAANLIHRSNEELARGSRLGYGSTPGVVGLNNRNELVVRVEPGVNYPLNEEEALLFQAGKNAPLLPTYDELVSAVDSINESGLLNLIGEEFDAVLAGIQGLKNIINRPDASNEEILSGSFLDNLRNENLDNDLVQASIDNLVSDYGRYRRTAGIIDVLTKATSRPIDLDTMQNDKVRNAEERGRALGLVSPITYSGVDIATSHLAALAPMNIYQTDAILIGNRDYKHQAPSEFYQDLTASFFSVWNKVKTYGVGDNLTFKEIEEFLAHKNIGEIYSQEQLSMMNDIMEVFRPFGRFSESNNFGGHSVALLPLYKGGKIVIPSLKAKDAYTTNEDRSPVELDKTEQGRMRSRRTNSIANAMAVQFMNQVFDGNISTDSSRRYDSIMNSDSFTDTRGSFKETTSTSESIPMPSPAGKTGKPNNVWLDNLLKDLNKFRIRAINDFFTGDYEQYKEIISDHLANGTNINSSNQAVKVRDMFLKSLRADPLAFYANDLKRLGNIYRKSGRKSDYDNFYFSVQRVSDIVTAFRRNKRSIAYKALEPDNVDTFFGLTYSNDILSHIDSYKYDYELNKATVTYVRMPSAIEMVRALGGKLDTFDSTNFGIDLNRQLEGFEDTVDRARLPEDNQLADAISRKGVENLSANYTASKNRTILAYYLHNRDAGAVRKFFAGYRNNAEGANSALLDMLHQKVADERSEIDSDKLSAYAAQGFGEEGVIPLIDSTGNNSGGAVNQILEFLNNNTGDRNNPDVTWHKFSGLVGILDDNSPYKAVAESLASSYGNLPVAFYRGVELNRNMVGYNTSGVLSTPQNYESEGVSKPQIGLVDVYSTSYENGGVDSFEKLVRDLFKTSLESRLSPEFHSDINNFKRSFNEWLNESLNNEYTQAYARKRFDGSSTSSLTDSSQRRTRLLRVDKHLTKYLISKGPTEQSVDFSNVDNAQFIADLIFDPELAMVVAEAGLDIQQQFAPSESGDAIYESANALAEAIINKVELDYVGDYTAVEAGQNNGFDPSFEDDADATINETIPVAEGIEASPYDTRALTGLIEATLRDLVVNGQPFTYEVDLDTDVVEGDKSTQSYNRSLVQESIRKPNQISYTSFLKDDVMGAREKEGHSRMYWNILKKVGAWDGDGNYEGAYDKLENGNMLTEGDKKAYDLTYQALVNGDDIVKADKLAEDAEKARQEYNKALDDVAQRAAGVNAGLIFSDNKHIDSSNYRGVSPDLVNEALKIGIKKGQKGSMSRRVMIATASAGLMSRIDNIEAYFRSIYNLPTDKNYDGSVEILTPKANQARKAIQEKLREEMDSLLDIVGDDFPLIDPLNKAVDNLDNLYYEYGEIKDFDFYDKFFNAIDYIYMNDVVEFMDGQVDANYEAPSSYTNIFEAAANREIPISDERLSELIDLKNKYEQSMANVPKLDFLTQEHLAKHKAKEAAVKHWMNRENELMKVRRSLRGTSSTVNRLVKGQLLPADEGFAKLVERRGFSSALDHLLKDDKMLKGYLKQIDAKDSSVSNYEFNMPFYAPSNINASNQPKWSSIDSQVADSEIQDPISDAKLKLHLGTDFPIGSRRLEQLIKKALTLKSANYSKLDPSIEPHKMLKDEIDVPIAILSQLSQSSEASDLIKRAANTALLELSTNGDYRSFLRMHNAVWSGYSFSKFAKNAVEGVNTKVAKKGAGAYMVDQSARYMRAFSGSSQAQRFISNELGILDHGWSGTSGRYGSDHLMKKYGRKVTELLKPIKNVEDASKTYAAAMVTNYTIDVDARRNFKRNLDLIERGANAQNDAVNSPAATVPLKMAFKNEMKAQQKGVGRLVRLLKQWEANTNFNRSNEEVFADLDRYLSTVLSKPEMDAIMGFRDIFKEMEAVVEFSAIMRGRPIGNFVNYVPVSSYDPRGFLEVLSGKVMTDTPEGAHSRTRFKTLHVNAVDFNPFRTVLKTLSNMTYASNTRGVYNYFGDAYGANVTGQDTGTKKNYMLSMLGRNRANLPSKDQVKIEAALGYLKSEVETLRDNDYNNAVNDHPLAKGFNMLVSLGYRQALTSAEQFFRQSAPVMVSYAATASPKKALRANSTSMKIIGSASSGFLAKGKDKLIGTQTDEDRYFNNLKHKMEKFFPKAASRGIDGLEELNNVFKSDKLFANPSILRKVAEGGKDVVGIIDKASNLISRYVVGAPDAIMLWAIIDAEYHSITGQDLANIEDGEVDMNAATQAQITAETYLAQSDTSKKGKLFQKVQNPSLDMIRRIGVSWSNVQASLTGRAGAGLSMMINGNDAETKKDGARLFFNNLIQSFVYNAFNARNLVYISAAALAMGDDDEMQLIQKNLHKKLSYDIGPLARSRKNNLDSEDFAYTFWVKSLTDSAGGFIPGQGAWATINATNTLLREGATWLTEQATGVEAPDYEFKFGNVYDFLNLVGPAGNPIANSMKLGSAYAFGKGGSYVGKTDLAALAAMFVGDRETLEYRIREIQKRNDFNPFQNKNYEWNPRKDFLKYDFYGFKWNDKAKKRITLDPSLLDFKISPLKERQRNINGVEGYIQPKDISSGWAVVNNPEIVLDASNDGDSFMVMNGDQMMKVRLYGVDTIEKKLDYSDNYSNVGRVGLQASKNKLTIADALDKGKDASAFTARLLENGNPTLITDNRSVISTDRGTPNDRRYAHIEVDWRGGRALLSEILIKNGYAYPQTHDKVKVPSPYKGESGDMKSIFMSIYEQ